MSKAILNSGLMPTRAHVCLWYSTYLPGASLLRPNVNELRTTCECDKILPMTPNGHTPGLQPLTFPCQFDIPVVRTTGPVGDRMQFDQLKRRDFITLLGGTAVALPIAASAQQTPKVLRVGFVGVQPRDAAIYVAFRKRMVELGYREDRYFTFEYIQTPSIDAYDASFRELAARKPDIVIAAGNEPALRAASAAAGTLPIVFLAIDFDPVERGYVASLARPGGNITGIFLHPLELAAKRIELVRDALPQARHVGLIYQPHRPAAA